MSNQSLNDNQLLLLLRTSPAEGLSRAVEFYGGAVKTICRNILAAYGNEDIEEAVADSFVALWKSIDNFDPAQKTALKSYLYGIARHTALCKRRSLMGIGEPYPLEDADAGVDVDMESELSNKINQQIIQQTVDSLESPDREIFILRYYFFERVKEIGRRLNLEPKFVENRLYRCKTKLKQELTERGIIL